MPERQAVEGDRERDAGLRGEELTRASWLLALVFVVGFVIVGAVVWGARRRRGQG